MSDVAVLHGNYLARGGGERVADSIARAFDAPLFYGYGNAAAIPDDDIKRQKLFDPTWVGRKLARRVHQYRDFRFMWHSQYIPEVTDCDVVIQSGNEFGWYVPRDHQSVVKYVHSPPRGPYDMFHKHGHGRLHRAYSLAAKTLYRHTITYPDVYLANSEVVANRCRKYWGVEPDVVYPPVDVDAYGPDHAVVDRQRTYLTFSRLYRHKRTREIVNAFEYIDATLIVGGDGPQRAYLQSMSPANVDVRGYLGEDEKLQLLAECDALIFNAENEDFGIVPIEAFASGTPVIGVKDGFTEHQICDGVNGILFDDGDDPADVLDAIWRFERDGVDWDADELQAFASQFSRERFERELEMAVDAAREVNQPIPKCRFDIEQMQEGARP